MIFFKHSMVAAILMATASVGCGPLLDGGEVHKVDAFQGLAVDEVFPINYPSGVCATVRNAPLRCSLSVPSSYRHSIQRFPDRVVDVSNVLSSEIRFLNSWVVPRNSPPFALSDWNGFPESAQPPITTLFSEPMEQVVTGVWEGWGSVCGRNAAGRVFCSDSQNGLYQTPYEVTELGSVQQLAFGSEFRCGLLADGTVRCKGAPLETRAANPYVIASQSGAPTALIAGLSNVVEIHASTMALWARHNDGTISCVGAHETSLLARPSNASTLAKLRDVNDAQSLAVSYSHVCLLRAGGAVNCFGSNFFAQVSGRESRYEDRLVTPPGLPPARMIRVSSNSSCIVSTTNEVFCWGGRDFVTVPSFVFPL